eukprot:m51a1_g14489 hypothetical protein (106) ;mRNA; r:739341-739658
MSKAENACSDAAEAPGAPEPLPAPEAAPQAVPSAPDASEAAVRRRLLERQPTKPLVDLSSDGCGRGVDVAPLLAHAGSSAGDTGSMYKMPVDESELPDLSRRATG